MITQLLIADSDTLMLERSRRYFTDRGYQVEIAADGLHCVDCLRRLPPDILVLEHELLWGGGDGVLAWLREFSPRRPETVILASSDPAAVGPPLHIVSRVKAGLRRPMPPRAISSISSYSPKRRGRPAPVEVAAAKLN